MISRLSSPASASISIAVRAMATPVFMSSVPGPQRRAFPAGSGAMRQGMCLRVPRGHTVSKCPSRRMGFSLLPARGRGPKRASSTLPKARWRCSLTRPPRVRMCWAASATQASTADFSSEGDSARTSARVSSTSAALLAARAGQQGAHGDGRSGNSGHGKIVLGRNKPFRFYAGERGTQESNTESDRLSRRGVQGS